MRPSFSEILVVLLASSLVVGCGDSKRRERISIPNKTSGAQSKGAAGDTKKTGTDQQQPVTPEAPLQKPQTPEALATGQLITFDELPAGDFTLTKVESSIVIEDINFKQEMIHTLATPGKLNIDVQGENPDRTETQGTGKLAEGTDSVSSEIALPVVANFKKILTENDSFKEVYYSFGVDQKGGAAPLSTTEVPTTEVDSLLSLLKTARNIGSPNNKVYVWTENPKDEKPRMLLVELRKDPMNIKVERQTLKSEDMSVLRTETFVLHYQEGKTN